MATERFNLREFLPYRLNLASERVSLGFAERYRAEYKMTRPEWRALAALGSGGRMTATEVGVHSTMHKTKVSRAVFALEQRRWLKREENAADRREEHLDLTALGRKRYEELAEMARAYEKALIARIGRRGLEALMKGLAAVEKAMEEGDPRRTAIDPP